MPRIEPTLLAAHIRRIAPADALTDAELVGRYAEHGDAAAFEVLVWRHSPMVWATCRRILRHQQDIEDAFQATFLALARAAGTLGTRQAVAGWLHRVAVNAALKLRADRVTTSLTVEVAARPESGDGELAGAVDEELDRLPERIRAVFVLCCLEGMTNSEAARELGCPVGTVNSRLHSARARLRARLARRGFGPLAGIVLVAAPPASVAAAIRVGAGGAHSPRLRPWRRTRGASRNME
jgi:RNA polymerase sigma factor (sigma-70 family)